MSGIHLGVLLSLAALVGWGVGDFLIQKSVKKAGDWAMVFFIDVVGVIIFFPFVYKNIFLVFSDLGSLTVLIVASLILLVASIFDFEALKEGKISVVEPVFAFEVPVTAFLAWLVIGEVITLTTVLLIALLIVGISMVSTKSWSHFKLKMEKGIFYAILATLAMGATNFIFGFGGRVTDPWMINWFTSLFLTIASLIVIASKWGLKILADDWRNNKKVILQSGLIDNLAWLFFTFSFIYIPITISTGISESYIALAALLGVWYNKEKLAKHQWLGLVICIVVTVVLAMIA